MRVLIRNNKPLIDEIGRMTPGVTAAARKVKAEMEARDRRDKELIEALKDLAQNDPEALRAVEVE